MSQDKRKLYMWFFVILITLAIGFVWIALLKYNISASMLEFNRGEIENSQNELKEKFDKEFEILKGFFERPEAPEELPATTTLEKESAGSFGVGDSFEDTQNNNYD